MLQPCVAVFVAQTMELALQGEQCRKDLLLPFLKPFVGRFARARSIDDRIGLLTRLNNGIHVLGIFVLCLFEREVIYRCKEVQDRHSPIAKTNRNY